MVVATRSTKAAARPKRNVTSAVEGLSVADVRRCLDKVRKGWAESESSGHFSLTMVINEEIPMTIQDFCFKFVLGHHQKRHAKSKTKGRGS